MVSAQKLLEDGEPVQALKAVADSLQLTPQDPHLYEIGSRALIAAMADQETLRLWDQEGRHRLYRQLLYHAPCPAEMLTFAHEAASNLTSGNREAIGQLVAELAPVLKAEIENEPSKPDSFKNVLIFLLTTRAVAGPWLSQTDLSRMHLDWFSQFTPQDLALPYSVMFNPDLFDQNSAELLNTYWPLTKDKKLAPDTALFLSWLAGQDAFETAEDLYAYLDLHLPGTQTDRAAAKALLLHHCETDACPKLDEWGLSDFRPTLAKTIQRKPRQTPSSVARQGEKLLQKRPYQALNAALHKFTPFLAGRRKPRVAICLSGQLRGYETSRATWEKTILRGIEPVFFVHSWKAIGRSDAQPFRYVLPFAGTAFPKMYRQIALAHGYDAMRTRYPTLFKVLAAGNQADPQRLKEAYQTDHIVLEDDSDSTFLKMSNQQKMHYKICAADQLAQEHGEFDLHMRIRPDLATKVVAFNWNDLASACANRPVIFAEKPYGLHYNNLMIGDQCAIGTPEIMKIYADTWNTFPDLAKAGLARCPAEFTGHVSLATNAWVHGLAVERFPIRFGQLQDAEPLSAADALAALKADSRDDSDDKQLIQAAQTDCSAFG